MTMSETNARTITIPIDEYFDLRTKAETSIYLMERLGQLDGRIHDLDRRLWKVECKQKDGDSE